MQVHSPSPDSTRQKATIYDVADLAGVSHQSVSRYMRGFKMRDRTTAQIEKALETLEYRPNLAARTLTTGRSHRIGALTHEINQVGPSLILQGATAAARSAGYLLDVVTLDMADEAELAEALAILMQHELAGIVAFASTDEIRAVFERTNFGMPVVIAGETETAAAAPGSDVPGLGQIVAHLYDLGHRRFAHIAGPESYAAARNRLHAVESALARRGLELMAVVNGNWSAESGYNAMMSLDEEHLPTAIIAANDQMALGAISAINHLGLRVPGDISVTGVDDTPEAAYYSPALSTVRLDFQSQGEQAFKALMQHIDGNTPLAPEDGPAPTLILRASTAPSPDR